MSYVLKATNRRDYDTKMKSKIAVIRLAIWAIVLATVAVIFGISRISTAKVEEDTPTVQITLPNAYFTALFGVSSSDFDEEQFARERGLESCTVDAEGITLDMTEADYQALTEALHREAVAGAQSVSSLPEIEHIDYSSDRISLTLAQDTAQVPTTIAEPLALIASAEQYWNGETTPAVTFTVEAVDNGTLDSFILYGETLLENAS